MTASRFALVIFDCDGVLIDSEPIADRVHARTLAACGYAIGEDELQDRFCGISDAEMLATIEREWGRALPDDYALRVAAALAQEYRCSLQPIAGIEEALAGLREPVCVASSGTPERIRLGLETVGVTGTLPRHRGQPGRDRGRRRRRHDRDRLLRGQPLPAGTRGAAKGCRRRAGHRQHGPAGDRNGRAFRPRQPPD